MAELSQFDYLFKEVFGDLHNLLPEVAHLQKDFPFARGQMVGKKFVEALDLEYEHGYTYAGNDVGPTLRAAISSEGVDAEITPSQIIGRKKIGYRDEFRTADPDSNKKAFAKASSKKVLDLQRGMRRNIEISLLHGRSANGLGVVEAKDDTADYIQITAATWCPGIWGGMKNAVIDVVDSDLTTLDVSDLTLSGQIDVANRRIYFSGSPNLSSVDVGDVLLRDTANTAGALKECFGLGAILRQVSGTSYANVDLNTHFYAVPNTYDCGARVIKAKELIKAAALVTHKGYEGDLIAYVPPRVFEELNDQEMGYRNYDYSYDPTKHENGFRKFLKYNYQHGILTVKPHLYMMEGDIYMVPDEQGTDTDMRNIRRIGSVDVTYELPSSIGGGDGRIFIPIVGDVAASEIRNYSDQCLLVTKGGHCVRMHNFTYSGS